MRRRAVRLVYHNDATSQMFWTLGQVIPGFMGVLDGQGNAGASLNLSPVNASFIGFELCFSAVVFQGPFLTQFSNNTSLEFVQ